MELAGLSVAQAVYKVHPIQQGRNILVLAGPGNNGKVELNTTANFFGNKTLTS